MAQAVVSVKNFLYQGHCDRRTGGVDREIRRDLEQGRVLRSLHNVGERIAGFAEAGIIVTALDGHLQVSGIPAFGNDFHFAVIANFTDWNGDGEARALSGNSIDDQGAEILGWGRASSGEGLGRNDARRYGHYRRAAGVAAVPMAISNGGAAPSESRAMPEGPRVALVKNIILWSAWASMFNSGGSENGSYGWWRGVRGSDTAAITRAATAPRAAH